MYAVLDIDPYTYTAAFFLSIISAALYMFSLIISF